LALFGKGSKQERPYRTLLFGGGLGTLFLVLTFLRDRAILGGTLIEDLQFAPYHAASGIGSGRLESFVTVSVLLTGFTVLGLYLFASTRALSSVFRRSEGKGLLILLAILGVGSALFLHGGALNAFPVRTLHLQYAPVIQSAIPGLLWIVVEVKARRRM